MLFSLIADIELFKVNRPHTSRYGRKLEHRSPSEQIAQEQCIVCNDSHDSALYKEEINYAPE